MKNMIVKSVVFSAVTALLPFSASASQEAEAIVQKMLAQKADLLRQAETYVVNERHIMGAGGDMGIVQPIFLYSSVCNPDRFTYALNLDDAPSSYLAGMINNKCQTDRPTAHSIVRPKEIEYMLMEGRYAKEKEMAGVFPLMLKVISDAGVAAGQGQSFRQGMNAIEAFSAISMTIQFKLEYLQRDIENAIQEEKDLREFGRVAEVIGEIEVRGRPAWALVARDLNRKQVTEDGEFTITAVGLAVDKTRHVQLAMLVEGVSKQGKRKKDEGRFAIAREDRDYRPIQGTTALIPYESVMMVKFQLEDEKSQRELEKARKEYEKAKAELEALKTTGGMANAALGNMFAEQFEAMERRLQMLESAQRDDFFLKTIDAKKMEAVLNGDGAGDVRKIEYAKKGDLLDYLALLANKEIDRDALEREYEKWQAQERAREAAEAQAESASKAARDSARDKELEELRKENAESDQ